jgi:hypothetical protein
MFEIYLNSKLLVRQYNPQSFTLQSLNLTEANVNDKLVIYYNHCGHPGKSRTIAIVDKAGNVLKKYNFGDGNSVQDGMSIPVKEFLALEKITRACNWLFIILPKSCRKADLVCRSIQE